MQVKHSYTIGAIDRSSWDEVSGATPLAHYDWLAMVEEIHLAHHDSHYWWVEDAQGVVAAAVALTFQADPQAKDADNQRYGFWAPFIRPVRRLLQRQSALVCGAQLAPGHPLLVRQGLGAVDRCSVINKLVDSIQVHCRANGLDCIFRSVLASNRELERLLSKRRFIRMTDLPNAVLDVRWNSWQAYLAFLKKHHASTEKSVRMQVNRGRREGVVIEELPDPEKDEADIHRILTEHYYRKNKTPLEIDPGFATRLKQNLGDRALIYVARKAGRVIGVSIFLRDETVLHWKFFGVAEAYVRSRNAVYFNLAFHHPIEQACTAGYRQIVMGTLPYRVKHSRGARLLPDNNWVWQPKRLVGLAQRVALAYAARRQRRQLEPYG